MPHRCTNCGRTFADGSKRMLTGCPECDGKKFEFLPPDAVAETDDPTEGTPPDRPDIPDPDLTTDAEDTAQASARRTVVSEDELPPVEDPSPTDAAAEEGTPDLADLRAELNDQFESIKILRPGEYELNLMELYDREEHIVALEEDGKYVIEVPSAWREE